MPHISDKIGQIHESDIFQLKIQIPDMKFFFSTLGGGQNHMFPNIQLRYGQV